MNGTGPPTSGFRVLFPAPQAERDAWLSLWSGWPRREVFAHPDYVQLCCGEGDRAACAA